MGLVHLQVERLLQEHGPLRVAEAQVSSVSVRAPVRRPVQEFVQALPPVLELEHVRLRARPGAQVRVPVRLQAQPVRANVPEQRAALVQELVRLQVQPHQASAPGQLAVQLALVNEERLVLQLARPSVARLPLVGRPMRPRAVVHQAWAAMLPSVVQLPEPSMLSVEELAVVVVWRLMLEAR